MGTGEESTPTRTAKPASSAQEIPTMPVYPDWSNSVQAYYGSGAAAPPFFASTVPSPTPHPYLWGGQHPLMPPPYGTPVPYPALYPAGGIYARPDPSMTTAPNSAPVSAEYEGKGPEGKDWACAKKSKAVAAGKGGEAPKATSGSGNDGASQSGESGTDGSSDGSDENQQEFGANEKGSFDQMLADANAQNTGGTSVPGKPVASVPATNLNIGMDLWKASAPGAAKIRPNAAGTSSVVTPAIIPEQWIQDEREMKRQKRKQSNRESARRSRLRKQAECEELQARVENLTTENRNLRDELQRLSEECEKLKSENDSIKDELTRLYGPDAVANLEQSDHSSVVQSCGDEGNS